MGAEQDAAAFNPVGHHSAEEGEQEDRDAAKELIESQVKLGMRIFQMSQPWAIICIHVPMEDVHAPIHISRKSRYWNALKTLRNTRSKSGLYQFRRTAVVNRIEAAQGEPYEGSVTGIGTRGPIDDHHVIGPHIVAKHQPAEVIYRTWLFEHH